MSSSAPRDSTAFEVRDALGEAGCVVCRLAVRSVGRWLASVAYEQVNDIALRTELRGARGFCNVHAHRWLTEVHSVLGTAIVYQDLLKAGLRELDGAAAQRGGGLWRALMGGAGGGARTGSGGSADGGCPACRMQTDAEDRYLAALLAIVAAEPQVLDGSEGACLRHTRAALRTGAGTPAADRLVEQTRATILRLVAQLDEVIRKEDYRFRHEPRTPDERTAPARAIATVAGANGLVDVP